MIAFIVTSVLESTLVDSSFKCAIEITFVLHSTAHPHISARAGSPIGFLVLFTSVIIKWSMSGDMRFNVHEMH